jgi:exonuclease SbcC
VRILSVQLSNVKSYASQTVRFEGGTNCICGENGAGKTTIVEAIGWALFDSLPYNQRQFKREGASSATVTVAFIARDDRSYEVVRKVGGAAPHWYVFDPEISARLAEGSDDVKGWLKRQLGTEDSVEPKVLFENAVGVPQGGLTAPFLQSPEARKRAFDPILRVHEYGEAATELLETNRHLEGRVAEQRERAARHGAEADRIPQITEGMTAAHDAAASAGALLAERRVEKEREDDRVAALEAEERRIAEVRANVELRRQQVADTRERHRQATARVEQAWTAHETVERTTVGHKLYADARDRLRALAPQHAEYLRLTAALDAEQRESERTERDIRARDAEIERAEAAEARLPELRARAEEAAELGRTVHALDQTADRVPRLQAELRGIADQITADEREAGRLDSQIAQAEAARPVAERVPALRDQREALVERLRAAQAASAQAEKLGRESAGLETKVQASESRLRALDVKARVDDRTRTLADSLPDLKRAEAAALEIVQTLREELATARARKEARIVACPLNRADCLALQSAPDRERTIDAEIARIVAAGKKARETWEGSQKTRGKAEEAVAVVQAIAVHRAQAEVEQRALDDFRTRHADLHADLAVQQEFSAQLPVLRAQGTALAAQLEAAEAAQRDVMRLGDLRGARERQAMALAALRERRIALETEIASLGEQVAGLAGLRARLAALAGATDAFSEARVLASALPEMRSGRDELARHSDEIAERLGCLRAEVAPLAQVEAAIRKAKETADRHQPDYEAYLANQTVAAELPDRQIEQKTVEAELGRQTAELQKQETALERALAGWDAAALQGARQRVDALNAEMGSLDATIRAYTDRLNELRAELERCEEEDTKRQAALREAERLEHLRETLQYARRTLKEAQGPVTEALLYGVSQQARTIFSDIVDDHSARLSWASDYEVQLERGAERLVFGQMSGGEQMSAALAVRLALLRTLSDVDVAFLDEPTQNMDETRRTNLAAQVRDVRGFEQLFVISHDDTFERQVSHAVVVRKAGGESVVTYGHEG